MIELLHISMNISNNVGVICPKLVSSLTYKADDDKLIIRRYCVIIYISHFWLPDFCSISFRSLIYIPISLIFMTTTFFSSSTVPVTYVVGYS